MSRIADRFGRLRGEGRAALVPYITAGDPHPEATVPMMHALVAAGADILELGVPFSDPMADGPVIQEACERALRYHVGLHRVLEMVAAFREHDRDTPVVLMGYLNPVEIMGYAAFAEAAAHAGVDGLLTVDLPPEEADGLVAALLDQELDPIFLVAPTSKSDRIARICELARGFVYYVSLKGVTGSAALNVDEVGARLGEIRRHAGGLPIGVGFGIRDAEAAGQVARVADAVVVGSAIVRRIAAHQDDAEAARQAVAAVVADMRKAMDAQIAEASSGGQG